MTEVWCANLECKANDKGKCLASIIHLHIYTKFPDLICECFTEY